MIKSTNAIFEEKYLINPEEYGTRKGKYWIKLNLELNLFKNKLKGIYITSVLI